MRVKYSVPQAGPPHSLGWEERGPLDDRKSPQRGAQAHLSPSVPAPGPPPRCQENSSSSSTQKHQLKLRRVALRGASCSAATRRPPPRAPSLN